VGRLVPFVIAFALGVVLMPAAILVGPWSGFVDLPPARRDGERIGNPPFLKIHARPISQLGGPAAVVAILGSLAVVDAWPPAGAVGGVAVATLIGLADDAKPLSPLVRAIALILAGVLVELSGVRPGAGLIGGLATVAAVFVSANAMNLIDGQDGLAGGVAMIGGIGLAAVAAIEGSAPEAGLAVAGAMAAFLLWNREPARVFLGNGGAYGVGAMLAVAAIETSSGGPAAMVGAIVCLGVLEAELVLTIARRLRGGVRLTQGDRGHSYDLLAARLGSRARSTRWFWFGAFVCASLGVLVALVR
jgi:UDP-GlcNAc:undecaprenyl-phosphate GlcNAc-1-phosphate transferase